MISHESQKDYFYSSVKYFKSWQEVRYILSLISCTFDVLYLSWKQIYICAWVALIVSLWRKISFRQLDDKGREKKKQKKIDWKNTRLKRPYKLPNNKASLFWFTFIDKKKKKKRCLNHAFAIKHQVFPKKKALVFIIIIEILDAFHMLLRLAKAVLAFPILVLTSASVPPFPSFGIAWI